MKVQKYESTEIRKYESAKVEYGMYEGGARKVRKWNGRNSGQGRLNDEC